MSGSFPPEPEGQSAYGATLRESQSLSAPKPDNDAETSRVSQIAKPVDAARWAKMAYWTPEEAACVTVGLEPESVLDLAGEDRQANEEALIAVDRRFEYIIREIEMGRLSPKLQPISVFQWLDAIDEPYPVELFELVTKIKPYGPVLEADPRIGMDAGKAASPVEAILPVNPTAMTRKNATLRKILLAIAMDCYGYDPEAKRSTAVKDIRNALELAGLSLDDDTIRKHLREATDAYWTNTTG